MLEVYVAWQQRVKHYSSINRKSCNNLFNAGIAFKVMYMFTPESISIGGPVLNTDVKTGAFVECWLSFLLMVCILVSSSPKVVSVIGHPIVMIAAGVRALLVLEGGKYTGKSLCTRSCIVSNMCALLCM